MKTQPILITQLVIIAIIGSAWLGNLYKLTQCDFDKPYKGEIIHAVGLAGPAALVTVWFDDK